MLAQEQKLNTWSCLSALDRYRISDYTSHMAFLTFLVFLLPLFIFLLL
jgi:hypothetical protein